MLAAAIQALVMGIGMGQALGIRFFDQTGSVFDARKGAVVLPSIAAIDLSGIDRSSLYPHRCCL
ncbi:hypothetical protein DB29_01545 [Shouchella clausii]|nr:hypothetical protein DB29_01545 [Shouchella clausii]